MYSCSFEKVATDLVEVGDGTEDMACYVALVIEVFEATPDVDVLAFGGKGFRGLGVSVAVYPLLYVD